jgi:hypothetical protein
MNKPVINILTRTSNRPNFFKINAESVKSQTYKNIKHIVSYDNDDDLNYLNKYEDITLVKINKLKLIEEDDSPNPKTGKYSPHNLYFNEMLKIVDDGWVLYLDDDDYFINEDCVLKIVEAINKNNEDTLIFWKFKLGDNLILPKIINKNNPPKLYNIGSCCVCFNFKHINIIKWDAWKCSDFRIINNLFNNVNKNYFINEVLVIAPTPGLGNRIDYKN